MRACREILDRKGALEPGNRIVRILDGKSVSLHEGMHAALHDDATAVPGETDDIPRPGLGQCRPVEHDEHVLLVPFIVLQIIRDLIQICHRQRMVLPHDRHERNELTDACLQFGFRKLERLPFFNGLYRHDHIFQALLSPNEHFSKQPIRGLPILPPRDLSILPLPFQQRTILQK